MGIRSGSAKVATLCRPRCVIVRGYSYGRVERLRLAARGDGNALNHLGCRF